MRKALNLGEFPLLKADNLRMFLALFIFKQLWTAATLYVKFSNISDVAILQATEITFGVHKPIYFDGFVHILINHRSLVDSVGARNKLAPDAVAKVRGNLIFARRRKF
jgi:hypothetical protein